MPVLVGTQAQIVAPHLAVADQLGQLIAGFSAASPGVGVLVDADLVQLRRIDAVEPVGHFAKLNGAAIPDDRARGEALARREDCQYQNKGTHRVHSISGKRESQIKPSRTIPVVSDNADCLTRQEWFYWALFGSRASQRLSVLDACPYSDTGSPLGGPELRRGRDRQGWRHHSAWRSDLPARRHRCAGVGPDLHRRARRRLGLRR